MRVSSGSSDIVGRSPRADRRLPAVSMVDAALFDKLAKVAQLIRKKPGAGKQNELPFGGIQVRMPELCTFPKSLELIALSRLLSSS